MTPADRDEAGTAGGTPPPAGTKPSLRQALLQGRAALSIDQRRQAGEALVGAVLPLVTTSPVAAYVSVGTEPPTGPLLDTLAAAGIEVLLPVLLPDGDLDWATGPARRRPGSGPPLLEPVGWRRGSAALTGCELVVVPALAVDRAGARLGRGGGSYDRALPRASAALTIAVLYDAELVQRLPSQPHDVPVRAVVLPATGLMRLGT